MAIDMRAVIGVLAELPEEQRRTMLRERLQLYAGMNETERATAMRQLIEAVSALSRDDAKKILASRAEVLAEFPEATRSAILKTHTILLQQLPEAAKLERELTAELASSLSPEAQRLAHEQLNLQDLLGRMQPSQAAHNGGDGETDLESLGWLAYVAASRRFADWALALLWIAFAGGIWLAVAPFVLNYDSLPARVNDIVVGLGVAAVAAGVAIAQPDRDDAGPIVLLALAAVASAWLALSPTLLGHTGTVAQTNDIVLGIGLAALLGTVAIFRPGYYPYHGYGPYGYPGYIPYPRSSSSDYPSTRTYGFPGHLGYPFPRFPWWRRFPWWY